MKDVMRNLIKQHHVIGKSQMKQVAAVAQEVKNDTLRRGGFAPSQWVLGRYPRRPGSLAEEDEWGQLGVLTAQQDPSTAFGLKASMRFTAQKAFVRLDCGRRYAAAMLRKARAVDRDYQQGDWIIYRVVQGSLAPIGRAQLGSSDSRGMSCGYSMEGFRWFRPSTCYVRRPRRSCWRAKYAPGQ